MKKSLFVTYFLWSISLTILFAQKSNAPERGRIDLSGIWHTAFGDCRLPGTTDESRLGAGCHDTTCTTQLTRLYPYAGKMTYSREVVIPQSMSNKNLLLRMERTKCSTLWIDGDSIGSINQLYAAHIYPLGKMTAGSHIFRIRIDNSDSSVPSMVRGSHAWTDATQTNWNGILGDFSIEALPNTYIYKVSVYPDVDSHEAKVKIKVMSNKKGNARIKLNLQPYNTGTDGIITEMREFGKKVHLVEGENELEINLTIGDTAYLWSEFHPSLYQLHTTIKCGKEEDKNSVTFGMRKFETRGTQFAINNKITFLRGTHDGCVFPLTGYCPTNVEEWQRVFRIAKSYGINHYRFHSYTPTEAAFTAADIEGIYLQCELPVWGSIEKKNTDTNLFLLNEARTAIDAFGNHPSFMMMGLGNELWGEVETMREWLDSFRQQDPRHLYCFGSNDWLGWHGAQEGEDYFVTCRMGGGEGFSTHTRSSFSFADADEGGILNSLRPSTSGDYSHPVSLCPRPVISHETSQFQIYPDYTEIPKYTGVLRPYNLQIFRERLKENGLSNQIQDFHQSNGRWAVDCYKADNEYCLRTPGFGGFQMLDIKDYPGQGTALVGLLDAFMDSKGLVTPQEFKSFCAPVVLFAKMDSVCFQTDKTIDIRLAACNYEEDDYTANIDFRVIDTTDGSIITSKTFHDVTLPQGKVTDYGTMSLELKNITVPKQLRVELFSHNYSNYYNLWVYPPLDGQESIGQLTATQTASVKNSDDKGREEGEQQIIICRSLDAKTMNALKSGARVLLVPRHEDIMEQSVGSLFTPDYWNYAMFKTISENNKKPVSPGTLGMLMDKEHPIFCEFPTEGRTDWQWWTIALNSRPLILNSLPHEFRPIIQVVDNVERNHKLANLLECRVGEGRLMICTTDLDAASRYLEGRWYRKAITDYMLSDEFCPQQTLTAEQVLKLFNSTIQLRDIQGVKNETDYKVNPSFTF